MENALLCFDMRHWRRVNGLEQGSSPLHRLSQLAVLQAILQATRPRARVRNRPARVARAHPRLRVHADPRRWSEGLNPSAQSQSIMHEVRGLVSKACK
ncbi:hypothetical protein TcWFU_000580 [Taenia crassiceps]|uniref:Uncharacterized protein n=1 Tax=Taenia crassiceps TaxID=6207 RepID=A0ABR4QCT0_9CEST